MKAYTDTLELQNALECLYKRLGAWRRVGEILGCSGAHARSITRGERRPGPAILANWQAFQTGERVVYEPAPVCPDCGSIHTGRCHGRPVGEVIVKAARPESPAWLREAAEWLRQREGSGPPILRSYTRQGNVYR